MSNKLLVSTRKGLFTLGQSAPHQWNIQSSAFLGDSVTLAIVDPRSGHSYAALNHGHFGVKLHRKTNVKPDWHEISTPTYPDFPDEREPDRCPMRGIEIPWKLELIWALVPGGADQPGRLWCGTLPGGLFRSDDHGDNWTLVQSLWDVPERAKWMGGGYDYPGIHSICVDPRNSSHITVAISCGGVWETTDDGASWSLIGQGLRNDYLPPDQAFDPVAQDPHIMVQCPSSPDHLWIQHHNGIFKSVDGGKSFAEIQEAGPSVFGFAAAVHPQNPDTAWFVPAIKDEQRIPVNGKLVVTRTRDGGESFEALSEGLPQTHAYDLVYRHALAIDESGHQLAMGSTTGNLWTTKNHGDIWTIASSTLPPIHSVSYF
ncbi:hypothetical protein [Pelagicoccus sp. SDUM812002]|uniref:WD40/YVTN/BNR-like repeat-containing protein n=1 Tax=Pelagicoccus sp. SDUM812002 TaxID=3041266 RepID=UPI00280FAE1D|nr:hypothetical protein [Pelagicoccus sp. SDUM812002]MDQ8184775.1 hypothetical protein [Pelagicoccus sp. SDUM812002]